MEKRKQNQHDRWDPSAYGTGSTQPPRNNGSLVTVLLILVICLAGLVSALGLLNIRLFRELERQTQADPASLSLFNEGVGDPIPELDISVATVPREYNFLGIAGESVSSFYQRYYHIPAGLYITDISPDSTAAQMGLQPGDVLISVNGIPATRPDALETQSGLFAAGKKMTLVIYRGGQELTLIYTEHSSEKAEK